MSKNTGTSELINYFDLGANGDVGIAGSLDINTILQADSDTDKFLVSDTGIIKYRTGAQLLSDIGAQGALTNPVTGTGTTNYLPKFTGSTTIGNSQVFDNGTNVGIGTASPVAKLTINQLPIAEVGSTSYGTAVIHGINYNLSNTQRGIVDINNIDVAAQNNGSTLTFTNNAGMFGQGYSFVGVGLKAGKENASNQNQSTYFAISTNSNGSLTEKMRLDASGNLGLGVTPSAWDSLIKAYETTGGSLYSYAGGNIGLAQNAYFDGTWKHKTTAAASLYFQASSSHFWYTAPSGTAGNAISFTQAMTLSSGGNLLVGTTTDNGARLQVSGTSTFSSTVDVRGELYVAYNATYGLRFYNDARNNWSSIGNNITGSSAANLVFKTGLGTALTLDNSRAATFSSSVTAADLIISDTYANDPLIKLASTTSGNAEVQIRTATTTYNPGIGVVNAGYDFNIFTNNTPRLTIASTGAATFSGQVSIGTTAPPWGAFTNMLNLQSGSIGGTSTTDFRIFQNMYYDGGSYRTRVLGESQRWDMGSGALYIYTAASAAANAVVTPTLKFSLLNTGAATFSSSVTASGAISNDFSASGTFAASFTNSNSTGYGLYVRGGSNVREAILIADNAGNQNIRLYGDGSATFSSTVAATQGSFTSAPSLGGNQVLAVSNSGSNTSYGGVLVINSTGKGGYLTSGDNSTATWYGAQASFVTLGGTAGAGIKLRVNADDNTGITIPTSGNVLIGTTTDNGARLQVSGTATFSNFNGAAVYGVTINSNNNTGTQYMMSFDRIGVQAGYIASTSSTTAGIFNSSDYRLKEDLQSFSGIGKLMSMKFYDFKWKSEEGFRDYGVIAHELQEVLPMAVIGEKDGEVNQGVDYSKLIPIMAKAIQELKAELDELKSKN